MEAVRADALIDRLIAKTEAGELRWKEGIRFDTYQISLPDYSVIVDKWTDKRSLVQAESYLMRILDARGDVVASFMDDRAVGILEAVAGRPYLSHEKMARLFAVAEQSVSSVRDKAVDDLLARLG